jgi:hypothetical protein
MRRNFTVKNGGIEPCPQCGNALEFVGIAERCAEDCCNCWIECKCGYDATAADHGERLEDVWGEISKDTLPAMIQIWNELIQKVKLD